MKGIFDLTGGATRAIEMENAGRLLRFKILGEMPAGEGKALTALRFLRGPRRYFLRGQDEAAVRALFTPKRLAAFEGVEPCVVAGTGTRLLYFEPDHLIWPGALDAFLGRASRIFDVIRG